MRISLLSVACVGLLALVALVNAKPIGDTVDVKFDQWPVASMSGYLHDPAVAPDGSIWYTQTMENIVGRFDPSTMQFKEFTVPTPKNQPHGLWVDKAGNAWYTGYSGGVLGRIDPKTGKIDEFKLPDPKSTPHSLMFDDRRGILYFSLSRLNQIGVLDSKTGKITLVSLPSDGQPHDIVLNSKGVPFFAESNGPNIGSIDPQTLNITEYALPDKGSKERRIAIAKDDTVWYADHARGYIGHLDPKSHKVEEIQSPGGATSKPQGMTITSDGAVWYGENTEETRPVLVRLNPDTKKMQTWVVPGGGGPIRKIALGKGDVLWLATSSPSKIVRVRTKGAASTH